MEEARARFLASGSPLPVMKERSQLVDEAAAGAFATTIGSQLQEKVALVAVGGYGRQELFPHSDIDLLLLAAKTPESAEDKAAISEFLRVLWDMGLRVSQSVRTVEECCKVHEGNFELTVSLLDRRYLCGNLSLFASLNDRFGRFIQSEQRDLMRRMCRMARSRHARYNHTIYRLEPDLKETPGGLRDLQTMHWIALLRGAAIESDSGDPRARHFLYSVRSYLHFLAGRDANLLGFEAQDEISSAPFSPWQDPAEWMRAYYRHASAIFKKTLYELEVTESSDRSLVSNFRDWRSRLSNSEFTVSRDLVFLRNPQELATDAELPLRMFRFVAKHGIALAHVTERRLVDHVFDWSRHYDSSPPKAAFWKDFLDQPYAVKAIRAMEATGLLSIIIPEWERIQHLVVRDFYHQYTVDEHTLMTLESLWELAAGDSKLSALAQESDHDLWLLKLALLLHDIGKGSGRDHSEEAVRLAAGFLERSGLDEMDAATVLFLIQNHLVLSSVIQSRDLESPETARFVATLARTDERLRLLTLMTYADIAGVNPNAMTPWRAEQLWRIYRIGHRQINGGLSEQRFDTASSAYGELTPEMKEFLDGIPLRYLWTHSRQQAEQHTSLFQSARQTGVAVDIARRDGAFSLTVIAQDRPFLFASLAGAIASFGLNIVRAEAASNSAGFVIDHFASLDPSRNLDLNPPEIERLKQVIKKVALGQTRAEDLLKSRPVRKTPGAGARPDPSVTIDSESAPNTSVFEVVAQDRPGLLHALASAISRQNCNIEVVLVDTEAYKAIDVFHVTRNGAKLSRAEAESVKTALLAACTPA
ncbi:MAG: [protein-PII] uridylyltransferase [Bryobacteraceae bacterium]|nr:[protein-PII] uridylyltransferase [Bryobacteraceae bacterium]